MLDALQRHGWRNDSLFLREDGLLVGHCKTPDFARAVAGMQDGEVHGRRQREMAGFFKSIPRGAADTSMTPLEEVLHVG